MGSMSEQNNTSRGISYTLHTGEILKRILILRYYQSYNACYNEYNFVIPRLNRQLLKNVTTYDARRICRLEYNLQEPSLHGLLLKSDTTYDKSRFHKLNSNLYDPRLHRLLLKSITICGTSRLYRQTSTVQEPKIFVSCKNLGCTTDCYTTYSAHMFCRLQYKLQEPTGCCSRAIQPMIHLGSIS